jgi:hypothetical protein
MELLEEEPGSSAHDGEQEEEPGGSSPQEKKKRRSLLGRAQHKIAKTIKGSGSGSSTSKQSSVISNVAQVGAHTTRAPRRNEWATVGEPTLPMRSGY